MRVLLFVLCTTSLVINSVLAQELNFGWLAQFDGQATVSNTKTDKSGAIYHLVNFANTVDFDPGEGVSNLTSLGYQDMALVKLSPDGKLIWTYQVGRGSNDGGADLVLDDDANIYFTGSFTGIVNFARPPATFYMTSEKEPDPGLNKTLDAFVCKIDSAGNFIWATPMGGSNSDNATVIALTKTGDVIIAGNYKSEDFKPNPISNPAWTYNTASYRPELFVSSFSGSTGSFISSFKITTGYINFDSPRATRPVALAVDEDSNIYLTGRFNSSSDFDPSAESYVIKRFHEPGGNQTNINDDIFIAKYSPDFELKWAHKLGGISLDYPTDLAIDANANLYLTGYTNNFYYDADFDPSENFYQIEDQNVSTFVAKYDSSGVFGWVKPFSKISGAVLLVDAIEMNPESNMYLAGTFTGKTDFDLSENEVFMEPTGSQSVFLVTYTNSGDYINSQKFVGVQEGASTNIAPKLHHDQGNKIYMGGIYAGEYDFDPTSEIKNFSTPSTIQPEGYLLELRECGHTSSELTTSACESFTANGETFLETGIYHQTIPNHIGCDSLITIDLSIHSSYEESVSKNLCSDEPFQFGSQTLTTVGEYTELFESSFGCDSLVNLNLVESPSLATVSLENSSLKANDDGTAYQWVMCDAQMTYVEGATEQLFSPSTSGSYAAIVSYDNCAVVSDCIAIEVLGTDQIQDPEVLLSPNPVVSSIRITTSQYQNDAKFTIYSLSGMVLFQSAAKSGHTFSLDLSHLDSGLYLVEIETDNQPSIYRILKD